MTVGVAISTTGDKHRLGFLETSVGLWRAALPDDGALIVTVDGTEEAVERAASVVNGATVIRVGQGAGVDGRMGVAVNKNTGLEALEVLAGVEHYFLSDDDTGPRNAAAWRLHVDNDLAHSMVCWGKSRLEKPARRNYTTWAWPRGVMLYAHRSVVEKVGGMVEEFGPGGHEHVEWSRRIHQSGLTPAPYCSPAEYAGWTGRNYNALGAKAFWECVDFPPRAKGLTSVRRRPGDWERIENIMRMMDGNPVFIDYKAAENLRQSATLYRNT